MPSCCLRCDDSRGCRPRRQYAFSIGRWRDSSGGPRRCQLAKIYMAATTIHHVAWLLLELSESHLYCPSSTSSRRYWMFVVILLGELTAFVSETTMALIHDGEVLGLRQLNMGNSG